jgi:hypothetical protein
LNGSGKAGVETIGATNRTSLNPEMRGRNMLGTVALHTVAGYTMGRDWVIQSCTEPARVAMGDCLNRNVWDLFPDTESIIRPTLEYGWATGSAHGMAVCHGILFEFAATVDGDTMTVTYEDIEHLDVTSLRSIIESLSRMVDVLERPAHALPARELHVVPA